MTCRKVPIGSTLSFHLSFTPKRDRPFWKSHNFLILLPTTTLYQLLTRWCWLAVLGDLLSNTTVTIYLDIVLATASTPTHFSDKFPSLRWVQISRPNDACVLLPNWPRSLSITSLTHLYIVSSMNCLEVFLWAHLRYSILLASLAFHSWTAVQPFFHIIPRSNSTDLTLLIYLADHGSAQNYRTDDQRR